MTGRSSLIILLCLWFNSVSAAEWAGESKDWNGFQRFDFEVEGLSCFVVVPKQAAEGNPWVWRARFPSYHAEADVLLLQRGFHIAHINTGGMLGSPDALAHWDAFYDLLTGQHGLAKKPALEAVSRGGLFAYRWAARHPDRVACIYADTPVCDIKSWPLGQGKGVGSEGTWKTLLTEFGFTHDEALAFNENPIDVLAPIAKARVPLLHIVSLNDKVVPPDENTFVLAERYRKLGGSIDIIEVEQGTEKSKGHHFTHPDIERVAGFIEQHARQVKIAAPATLLPSHQDVAYAGTDPAQVLDVYQADSAQPTPVMIYIHGGGWRAGSKAKIPAFLSQAVSEGWLSVVSVEYRFTDVAIHPAQVSDCMRAVKFVRSKAKDWNLDPQRIGVMGGSAGAHLSLWLALHDDAADPDSEDPVARQSSRVSCAISFAGPTDWELLSEIPHAHPAYRQLLGYEPGTPAEEMDAKMKTSVSPITFASADDPPILLVHGDADTVVPIEHAQTLDARMKKVGGDSELFIVKDGSHNVAGSGGQAVVDRSIAFIKQHLLGASAGPRKQARVAIVVGPSNHAPGTHEVAAGGRLMAHCLNNAANVNGIRAQVFYQWPDDRAVIDSASTVVFIGDQFPAERLENSDAAMRDLEEMTARGCGVVCIHYATGLGADDVGAEDGEHPLLHWTGGYFATRCNHHQSVARIFEATITQAAPKGHPLLRGWKSFQVRDEPYTRNWFGRDGLAEGAISLATVQFPVDDPKTETVAWAIERKDGGRGAGITMPHFFRNWEREELRRFILNTIVWTAQREVPDQGVRSTLPDLASFKPVSVDPQPRPRPKAANKKGKAKAKAAAK